MAVNDVTKPKGAAQDGVRTPAQAQTRTETGAGAVQPAAGAQPGVDNAAQGQAGPNLPADTTHPGTRPGDATTQAHLATVAADAAADRAQGLAPGTNQGDASGMGARRQRAVPESQLAGGRLNRMLASDSPLLAQARQRSAEAMASRGLTNTSIAAGAAEAAAIAAASPIAQAEAQELGAERRQASLFEQQQKLQTQQEAAAMARQQSQQQFMAGVYEDNREFERETRDMTFAEQRIARQEQFDHLYSMGLLDRQSREQIAQWQLESSKYATDAGLTATQIQAHAQIIAAGESAIAAIATNPELSDSARAALITATTHRTNQQLEYSRWHAGTLTGNPPNVDAGQHLPQQAPSWWQGPWPPAWAT